MERKSNENTNMHQFLQNLKSPQLHPPHHLPNEKKFDFSLSHLAQPKYACFSTKPDGSVHCSCRTVISRPYRSNLDIHLESKGHQSYEKATRNLNNGIQSYLRPTSEVDKTPEKIFGYLHVAHLLNCNIPLSTPLFNKKYVAALRLY